MLTKEQEREVVSKYRNGESIRKIALDYPVGRTAIGCVLRRYGVETKSTGNSYGIRKYSIDKNYFEYINTEEKAYWLGFVSADGHVNKRKDGVVINLCVKDKSHLSKFLQAIGSNSNITYSSKTNSCRVSIYSRKLVSDLKNLGLFHNKSQTLMYPDINDNLQRHFIRGLLDGDGSVTSHSRRNRVEWSVKFSGTYTLVKNVREHIVLNCNVSKPKIQRKGAVFSIVEWGGNRQVKRILEWLYLKSSCHLDRKYAKYKEMINEEL